MERAAGRSWTFAGGLPECPPETPVRWGGFALVAGGALGIVSWVVALLLVLGLLGVVSLPYFYSADTVGGEWLAPAVVPSLALLLSAGWVLLGFALVGARGRERGLVEAENLALARRLYEEAWGNGNDGVIHALVAPTSWTTTANTAPRASSGAPATCGARSPTCGLSSKARAPKARR